jgi:carboxyl-terminal processing protease
MSNFSKIFTGALLVIVIAFAFAGGFYAGKATTPPLPQGVAVIDEAWNDIMAYYVEPSRLNTANMTGSAVAALVAALNDRHSAYASPAEYKILQSQFEGSFSGIGANVSVINGKIVIVSPIKGAPAEKAGILAGDIITKINGESTEGMTLDITTSKIRGKAGTDVVLTILRGTETLTITVTRAQVEVPTVILEMKGDIAHITITQFGDNTDTELEKVLNKTAAANATGIVLDLRGNPGGLLDTVVNVASRFIKEGVIVSVRSRVGDIEKLYAQKKTVTTTLPIVVLVDENSASGSEVLSGALQDYDRALIAGNVTYGKGSVNQLLKLQDGSGIYLTMSRWLTPKDRLIEGNGIQPDVKLDITGDAELQWAIDYLHGLIR